jgi:two-component system chemotaxis response regulator CheY
MLCLIVEDDFVSRKVLTEFLASYGPCNVAVNGLEAVEAVKIALAEKRPYDLICMDIMMPGLDGTEALKEIRKVESAYDVPLGHGAKVFMTTGAADSQHIVAAFHANCDAYLVKPINRAKLEALVLEHLELAIPDC